MTQTILTIDIGGTALKAAIYDSTGRLIAGLPETPSDVRPDGHGIDRQIAHIAQTAQKSHKLDGCAISSCTIIHPYEGTVLTAGPNIPNYTGTELKKTIEQAAGIPCTADNDVNCAALGENWLGAAKDSSSVFCITIGTGVGGAMLMDGKLWRGFNYAAGEIGFIPTALDGERLEAIASTAAMVRYYQEQTGETANGRQIFDRAAQGEAAANAAIDRMIDNIAFGLCAPIYLFAPETIIVGGGVAQQKAIFEPKLREAVSRRMMTPYLMPKNIRCAALGNRAGMLGALKHFLQCQAEGRLS